VPKGTQEKAPKEACSKDVVGVAFFVVQGKTPPSPLLDFSRPFVEPAWRCAAKVLTIEERFYVQPFPPTNLRSSWPFTRRVGADTEAPCPYAIVAVVGLGS